MSFCVLRASSQKRALKKISRQETPNSMCEGVYVETKILSHNLQAQGAISMSEHLLEACVQDPLVDLLARPL